MKTAGLSYEQIERDLAREFKSPVREMKGPLKDLAPDASFGSPMLDRQRNRYLVKSRIQFPGNGSVDGLTVGHFGKDGIVTVHSYADSDEFGQWLPTFTQLNDSFQYDDGYTFTPGSASGILGGTVRDALISVVGSAVIGAVLGYIAWLHRKRKRAAALLKELSELSASSDPGDMASTENH